MGDAKQEIMEAIDEADREKAVRLMEEWADENGYDNLMVDLISPVLHEVGEMWRSRGDLSLARIYLAAKVAEDGLVLLDKAESPGALAEKPKGPVVVGNIEDDCHPLGRRIVVAVLKADGWEVHDLGNDVPAEDFVDKALELGAKVIGVSAMIYTTAENIAKVRKEIDARCPKGTIQLAVGGAVFQLRPELAEAVGGDGTAENALEAPALFARLWRQAEQQEDHSDE